VHKHYSVDDWRAFIGRSSPAALAFACVSCGASDSDFDKLAAILALSTGTSTPKNKTVNP
jgi:GMP reductase